MKTMQQSTLKQELYCALEDIGAGKPLTRLFAVFLLVLICANALVVFIPLDYARDTHVSLILRIFSLISTFVFFLEYCAHMWIADMYRPDISAARARLRYGVSFLGVVDLLAFLPAMIALIIPLPKGIVSVITLLRLVRLIKLTRYMRGVDTILRVVKRRRHEIVASFMVLGLLALIASVLMYEVEHVVQPDKFDSVLTGMYWAITTMSSTGYGDLTPITPLGRFIGWALMVLSIAVVAIPGGIFSAGFVEEFRSSRTDITDKNA